MFDLGSVDLPTLTAVFPAIRSMGLRDGLSGELQINIDQLSLDPQGMKSAKANVRLSNGRITLKQYQTPIDRLNADLSLQDQKLEIRDISCRFAEGSIKISGTVDQPMSRSL